LLSFRLNFALFCFVLLYLLELVAGMLPRWRAKGARMMQMVWALMLGIIILAYMLWNRTYISKTANFSTMQQHARSEYATQKYS
jgi:hypothetical protein